MRMSGKIAVVGMAGIFPEADTIHDFYNNLAAGRDSIRPLSAKRIKTTTIDPNGSYLPFGFIERIDEFDYEFFRISKAEAEFMDPAQRLSMQVVYQAIEDSGLIPDHLRGTNTAVIAANPNLTYHKLIDRFDSTIVTGNLAAALPGRIARHFDLRGPAFVVDTACSASLVAILQATEMLQEGKIDCAIVCSAMLTIFPNESGSIVERNGIASGDGKVRAFSDDASGTGGGEAVCAVILMREDDAAGQALNHYGYILGGAMNQDAALSASLTAPSAVAQANVLQKAWTNAGIDPADICYIETHGTGTKLGDPIEVDGIRKAFEGITRKTACRIGSVKSNIGHADTAAGMVSFIKMMLASLYRSIPATINADRPNRLIDFENSQVTLLHQPYQLEHGKGYLAGISSFGIVGTNCHLVVDLALSRTNSISIDEPRVAFLSAPDHETFEINRRSWINFVAGSETTTASAHTVTSKKHYPVRAVLTGTHGGLIKNLEQAIGSTTKAPDNLPTLLVLTNEYVQPGESWVNWLTKSFKQFAADYDIEDPNPEHKRILQSLVYQFYQLRYLEQLGITFNYVLADGNGKLIHNVLKGRLLIEQLASHLVDGHQPANSIHDRLIQYFEQTGLSKLNFQLIKMSEVSNIASLITGFYPHLIKGELILSKTPIDLLSSMFLDGTELKWRYALPFDDYGPRIPYAFRKNRVWIREEKYDAAPALKTTEVETGTIAVNHSMAGITDYICSVFKQILKTDAVKNDSDFFDLGGHSLLATQLFNRIRKDFDVEVDMELLYDAATPNHLAQHISNQLGPELPDGEPQPTHSITLIDDTTDSCYPVSYGQGRMWMQWLLEPASRPAYNMLGGLELGVDIDLAKFQTAIKKICSEYEILRTTLQEHNGTLVQKVHAEHSIETSKYVTESTISNTETGYHEYIEEELAHSFDLSALPLIRFRLIRQPIEGKSILLINMHHVISDAWTVGLLLNKLSRYYFSENNLSNNKQRSLQYRDYANWQRNAIQRSDNDLLQFWINNLSGSSRLDIPTIGKRHVPAESAVRTAHIAAGQLSWMNRFQQQFSVSQFVLWQGIFKIVLSKITGQYDLTIGTVTSGREHLELEDQLGFFVNTICLRSTVNMDNNFTDQLQAEAKMVSDAMKHGSLPFDKLVEELDENASEPGRHPLFDVMIVMQNSMPGNSAHEGAVSLTIPTRYSKFELQLNIESTERDGVTIRLEYKKGLFAENLIESIVEGIRMIAESMDEERNWKQPLSSINIIPTDARERMAKQLQGKTEMIVHTSLSKWLYESMDKGGEALCVVENNQTYSYSEILSKSVAIASILQSNGIGPNSIVAIHLSRSVDFLCCVYATIMSGAAILPIDPAYPESRKRYMIEDSKASLLLQNTSLQLDTEISTVHVDRALINVSTEFRQTVEDSADSLSHVIYTSGSTGNPKGVCCTRENLINYLLGAKEKYIDDKLQPGYRFAFCTSVSFDLTLTSIFLPVLTGGIIEILDGDIITDRLLDKMVVENRIHIAKLTPSHLSLLLSSDWSGNNQLRYLICGGEQLLRNQCLALIQKKSDLTFYNEYGPTETTVGCVVYACDHTNVTIYDGAIPIGKPMSNVALNIVDEHGSTVPAGSWGELLIGGKGVAKGYLYREELTELRFLCSGNDLQHRHYKSGDYCRLLDDGNIEYKGRRDSQVKIRGNRLEISEIETTMANHPDVTEAIVVVSVTDDGEKDLYGYVVTGSNSTISEKELKRFLQQALPSFAIPTSIRFLKEFPLTASGKADRIKLAEWASAFEQQDTENYLLRPNRSKSSLHDKVTAIWEQILKKKGISLDDDFFEHGGHSLRLMKLLNKLQQDLSIHIGMADFLKCPTIRTILQHDSDRQIKEPVDHVIPFTHSIENRYLFYLPPIVGFPVGLESLFKNVTRYNCWGFIYTPHKDFISHCVNTIRSICPEGSSIQLIGYSSGGNIAFEVMKMLQQDAYILDQLILIDSGFRDAGFPKTTSKEIEIEIAYWTNESDLFSNYAGFAEEDLAEIITSYMQYMNNLENAGLIHAPILNFVSSDGWNGIDHEKWETATTGGYKIMRGKGNHIDLLMPANRELNINRLKKIFEVEHG